MMNKTKLIAGVLVVGLLAGAVYLYFNFNGIVTRTTERIASNALGVAVNIGSIDVSLSNKTVDVNTIEIDNPPGYTGSNAITVDSVMIGLNTASRELIDFNDIQVKGSVVNVEVNQNGMNLIDLKKLANRKEQTENVGSEQIRVIIKKMVVDASVIKPRITLIDRDLAEFKIPAIRFANIGNGGKTDASEVIVQVITKYINEVEQKTRQNGVLSGVEVPGVKDAEERVQKAKEKLNKFFKFNQE